MPYHFANCYTTEEVKARYKTLAKTLHPDKGGTKEDFQELQNQYEQILESVKRQPALPVLYKVGEVYVYSRCDVVYYGCDNHYYKFHKHKGADIWIDSLHTHLIKYKF